jgi:hypothetical protein
MSWVPGVNLAVDQTSRVPDMVPSGKAIVSAWAAYPKTVGLMGQPDDVLIQTEAYTWKRTC